MIYRSLGHDIHISRTDLVNFTQNSDLPGLASHKHVYHQSTKSSVGCLCSRETILVARGLCETIRIHIRVGHSLEISDMHK